MEMSMYEAFIYDAFILDSTEEESNMLPSFQGLVVQ